MNDDTHFRRYELKYTISESKAAEIREYINGICIPDPHIPPGQNGYTVNNLYFDTPDLRFYTDTKFRKMTRYKPRARFYGDQVGDYIWPEIKYRHASIIWKRRQAIPVEKWPHLFSAQLHSAQQPEINPRIDSFEELVYWYNASAVMHVRYFREAYVTTLEQYGRITFDRRLCYRPLLGSIDLEYREADMIYYDDPVTTVSSGSYLILEIKVETLLPYWVVDMIRRFRLKQRPFSKYCYSIDHLHASAPSERNVRQQRQYSSETDQQYFLR